MALGARNVCKCAGNGICCGWCPAIYLVCAWWQYYTTTTHMWRLGYLENVLRLAWKKQHWPTNLKVSHWPMECVHSVPGVSNVRFTIYSDWGAFQRSRACVCFFVYRCISFVGSTVLRKSKQIEKQINETRRRQQRSKTKHIRKKRNKKTGLNAK